MDNSPKFSAKEYFTNLGFDAAFLRKPKIKGLLEKSEPEISQVMHNVRRKIGKFPLLKTLTVHIIDNKNILIQKGDVYFGQQEDEIKKEKWEVIGKELERISKDMGRLVTETGDKFNLRNNGQFSIYREFLKICFRYQSLPIFSIQKKIMLKMLETIEMLDRIEKAFDPVFPNISCSEIETCENLERNVVVLLQRIKSSYISLLQENLSFLNSDFCAINTDDMLRG